MSHKEHREKVRLLKKYNTGPSARKCDHKDCWKPKNPSARYAGQAYGHVCYLFMNDICVCGKRMKRGLGYAFEEVENAKENTNAQILG